MLIAGDCRPPGQNWHLREAHHGHEIPLCQFWPESPAIACYQRLTYSPLGYRPNVYRPGGRQCHGQNSRTTDVSAADATPPAALSNPRDSEKPPGCTDVTASPLTRSPRGPTDESRSPLGVATRKGVRRACERRRSTPSHWHA